MYKLNLKKNVIEANEMALQTTERIGLKTIKLVEDFQTKTDSNIKKALKFSAKKQDLFFNHAENAKGKVWKKLNNILDFFGKK